MWVRLRASVQGFGRGGSTESWVWSVDELVFGRRDKSEGKLGHESLPRHGPALVVALGNVSKQREPGVRDAVEQRDDERGARIGFDPGMIVFGESVSRIWCDVSTPQ